MAGLKRSNNFLLKIGKSDTPIAEIIPKIIPTLYCGWKSKMIKIPAIDTKLKRISVNTIFLLKSSGSKKEVKKPAAEIQTTAMEAVPYFTLP